MAGFRKTAALFAAAVAVSSFPSGAAFHASSFTPARIELRSAACSSARPSAGATKLQMGFRDNVKKVVGAAGAALAIAVGVPRAVKADAPRVELPSQEEHRIYQQSVADGTYKPLPLKIVTHPAFIGGVGITAAGVIGKKTMEKMKQKKTDDYRKNLGAMSGLNIDASILDEARINRPGAAKFEYSGGGPKYGQYRPPPEKLMQDVRDKYVMKDNKKKPIDDAKIQAASTLDIFKSSGGASGGSGDSPAVELVDDNAGPKTGEQKELEKELDGLSMEEIMEKAMSDPTGMDPGMMAAALPQLQAQLSEVLKDGISKEEVEEVRKSFEDMGIDLEEMFKSVDEMEASGMSDSLGAEGTAFFKTLRKILDTAK